MKIAIIGSGVAGLSAAWLLSKYAAGVHQVTLFEKESRLGGHVNTIDVTLDGVTHPVDTGFLVYNDWTYPNLIALFEALQIETAPSDMSFGIKIMGQDQRGVMEWCGSDKLSTVFAQPSNVLRPAFWSMLKDMLRFNREATLLSERSGLNVLPGTLGEYLDANHYSQSFRDWYLKPMAACIWSTPTQQIDQFPLATFIAFCRNHGLVSVNHRPQWRTPRGGARTYVNTIARELSDVRLNARIDHVALDITVPSDAPAATGSRGCRVVGDGLDEYFDEVIFACHTDQTRVLLNGAHAAADAVLGQIPYQTNTAILHHDTRLLPDRRRAWAAWNYMAWEKGSSAETAVAPVSLSYLINRLQPLPFKQPVIVTMNPLIQPDPAQTFETMTYEHPVFLAESTDAKQQLRRIQGARHVWFAGAWTRYGFHEDGLMSGIAVAKALGVTIPWETNVPAANDLSIPYPGVDA